MGADAAARRPVRVVVVLPCFRVEATVGQVVGAVPPWVAEIVAVDDGSPDRTGEILEELAALEPRLTVLRSDRNRGVGGAMRLGIEEALRRGADVVVKVDADGQMDLERLPDLLRPLLEGRADLAKGNRLRTVADVAAMPRVRLLGNVGLTFLVRAATGYWHVLDPTNGYLAIDAAALRRLRLDRLDEGYFFEISLLGELAVEKSPVVDVPMPAIYGGEISGLRIGRALATFPGRLARLGTRRILLEHALYDVSPVSLYLAVGFLLTGFATLFGLREWWLSATTGVPASPGTVALAFLPFLLGFNLLLEAVRLDIGSAPRPRDPEVRLTREEVVERAGGSGTGRAGPADDTPPPG